jgi:hypothetical protein
VRREAILALVKRARVGYDLPIVRFAHRGRFFATISSLILAGCAAHSSASTSEVRAFGSSSGSRAATRRNNSRVIVAATEATPAAPSAMVRNGERSVATANNQTAAVVVATTDVEERTAPVEGTDVRAGVAVGELDASFATVSATLLDFASYRHFLPRINESRVVRRRRGESDVYLRAELLEGLGTVWSLQRFTVTRATGSLLIVGTRVDGTMRRFDVRIEASEIAGTGRTRLAVQLLGLPPFPLPTGYLTRMHGRWTARSFRALRDWVYVQRRR